MKIMDTIHTINRPWQVLNVGLLNTSQKSFPGDKEGEFRRATEGLQKLANDLGFKLTVYPETVITREDAIKAVAEMEAKKVDFLLVQHTSYTPGQVTPVLAKSKARLGYWAIPEGTNTGVVPFNSFCSINMHMGINAHYLKDYKIPIKWFYGYADDQNFVRRFAITVRALTAIKNLCCSRVGLVGGIAPGFNDLYDDERNINRRFEGLYFNRLHEYSEIKDRALSYPDEVVEKVAENMLACSGGVLHHGVNDTIKTSARVYLACSEFCRENQYDAIAISCWPKFQQDFKYSVCSVVGQLNDEGIVVACEGDVLSAVSMLALKYLAGGQPSMLMDMSAFDENDNTVLLWHCGPAASHFSRCNGYKLSVNYHGMEHEPGKGVTSWSGVTRDMVFDENDATVMRFSGECDRLLEFRGRFLGDCKPSPFGSRGWMGSLTMDGQPIAARDLINTILVKGFQHHFPVILGNYEAEILEMAAWLGIKPIRKVPYADYLQTFYE